MLYYSLSSYKSNLAKYENMLNNQHHFRDKFFRFDFQQFRCPCDIGRESFLDISRLCRSGAVARIYKGTA